jgi:hypothetical protein
LNACSICGCILIVVSVIACFRLMDSTSARGALEPAKLLATGAGLMAVGATGRRK